MHLLCFPSLFFFFHFFHFFLLPSLDLFFHQKYAIFMCITSASTYQSHVVRGPMKGGSLTLALCLARRCLWQRESGRGLDRWEETFSGKHLLFFRPRVFVPALEGEAATPSHDGLGMLPVDMVLPQSVPAAGSLHR